MDLAEPKHNALAQYITGWKTTSAGDSLSKLSFKYKNITMELPFCSKLISKTEFQQYVQHLNKKGLLEAFYIDPNEKLPYVKNFEHDIELKPNAFMTNTNFPIPKGELGEHLRNIVRHYIRIGVFEHCTSPFNVPLLLVKKPNRPIKHKPNGEADLESVIKAYRIVLSTESVNQITRYDASVQIDARDVIEKLKFKNVLCVFDFKNFFWQFLQKEESRKYFAFSVPGIGQLTSTRVTQGYQNSRQFCARALEKIFRSFWMTTCGQIFVDDVSMGFKTLAEAKTKTEEFLHICVRHNLKLDPAKAQMFCSEVSILGERVSKYGMSLQRKHIEKLQALSNPKTTKDLERIAGVICWNCHRDPRISKNMTFLYKKLEKDERKKTFNWTTTDEKQLKEIVDIIIKADAKSFLLPNMGQSPTDYPIVISTDASMAACGIAVCQLQPKDIDTFLEKGKQPNEKLEMRLLDCYTRRFKDSEKGWSIYRREITALMGATIKFEYYFMQFNTLKVLRVDSKSIKYCLEAASKSTLMHQLLYNLEANYRPICLLWCKTSENPLADFLTHIDGENLTRNRIHWLKKLENQGKLQTVTEPNEMDKEDEADEIEKKGKRYGQAIVNSVNYESILNLREDIKDDRKKMKMRVMFNDIPHNSVENPYNESDDEEQVLYEDNTKIDRTHRSDRKHILAKQLSTSSQLDILQKHHKEYHLTKTATKALFDRAGYFISEAMIDDVISKCPVCPIHQISRNRIKEPAQLLQIPGTVFEEISMDVIGPFSRQREGLKEYEEILVARCCFSGFTLASPVTRGNQHEVIRCIEDWTSKLFMVLPNLSSDNALYFRGKEIMAWAKRNNTRIEDRPAMAPDQINVERIVREVKDRMNRYEDNNWLLALPKIISSINLSPSVALKGFSPYEVVFQRKANIGKYLGIPNKFYSKPDQITINLDDFRRDRLDDKTENLVKRKIKVGSKVWIRMPNHKWSKERHQVIGITRTGIRLLTPKGTHEVTRNPRDIKM